MTRFPIFERLDVESYGMFPGTRSHPGLHATFEPGLTLVLGAKVASVKVVYEAERVILA